MLRCTCPRHSGCNQRPRQSHSTCPEDIQRTDKNQTEHSHLNSTKKLSLPNSKRSSAQSHPSQCSSDRRRSPCHNPPIHWELSRLCREMSEREGSRRRRRRHLGRCSHCHCRTHSHCRNRSGCPKNRSHSHRRTHPHIYRPHPSYSNGSGDRSLCRCGRHNKGNVRVKQGRVTQGSNGQAGRGVIPAVATQAVGNWKATKWKEASFGVG